MIESACNGSFQLLFNCTDKQLKLKDRAKLEDQSKAE